MPIYEYVCPDCDLKFELLRPFSKASDGASCPGCHNHAERVMSACAVFSKSEDGFAAPLSGSNACASCGAASCDTCHL